MQWNGVGTNEDNKDVAHLQGFIENVSYEDVFSDYRHQNFTVLSAVPTRTNSKSSYDDEEVWAILVTPKPITVKDSNKASKTKKLKKNTIHDYDKKVRQQKRKISDLAIQAVDAPSKKKVPKNPIAINQTEFGEKYFQFPSKLLLSVIGDGIGFQILSSLHHR